jgi:hypothetical protein
MMLTTLYPSYYRGNVKPNYGMLAKLLNANDAEYVLGLIYQQSAKPPTGDPARFVAGIANKKPGPSIAVPIAEGDYVTPEELFR